MANSRAQKARMKTVSIEPHFQAWRKAARALLAEQCHPSDVLWSSQGGEDNGLLFADELSALPAGAPRLKVPKSRLSRMLPKKLAFWDRHFLCLAQCRKVKLQTG